DLVTPEAANSGTGALEQLLDRGIRILDEGLAEQRDLGEVLAQAAFNHLLDDISRLAGLGGLGDQDVLFLCNDLGRHFVSVDELRLAGSDMHGDVARDIVVAAFDIHEYANARAMEVAGKLAPGMDNGETAHAEVLADLGDQLTAELVEAGVVDSDGIQGFEIGGLGGENRASHPGREVLEVVTAGDEVGLAVHFDDRGLAGGFVKSDFDTAFGCYA